MTLQNLLAIKRLQAHTPDRAAILKLLEAARRNLADAHVQDISADNRFDAAYKCLMQCAMLGLWASGYRTSTSQPGHHQTAIQCLSLTMNVANTDVIVLDALRRQRNLSDYEGDPVSGKTLASCLEEAGKLLAHTEQWLRQHHPHLLGDA
ncbi:DNA-binding protein [Dyella sp.]|uniref:DNA-binding protein n=1 Tax=Dyella sp. TaxID=1869338 RepID=UPI002D76E4F5|nr:DNA-binding protein [Dyella sp.]HET7332784.1 DNA-binding protein [Dyella sp.]